MPVAARLVPACLAAALLAAGCGDRSTQVAARDGAVTLVQTDFRFTPQAVRARPGPLEVRLVNRGRLPHNLRVQRGGRDWIAVAALQPGERASVRARLPAGDYKILCTLANHAELGMYGTLTVR
jgi:plastocyanin